MISKSFFLLCFIMFSNVNSEVKVCMTPGEFTKESNLLFTKGQLNGYQSSGVPLHQSLFSRGSLVGKGGFGEVRTVNDKVSQTAIKKVKLVDEDDKSFVIREVQFLRTLCKHHDDDASTFTDCNSKITAPFYGCIEDKSAFYLFSKVMHQDFSSQIIKNEYRSLNYFDRLKAMLNIIDKYIELHKFNIVHSDIKPSNIMSKDNSISQFRIIDFGLANYKGKKYLGGTHGYLPPERYGEGRRETSLDFTDDVFSLAMTLAELEGDFDYTLSEIKRKCFDNLAKRKYCYEHIIAGLSSAFHQRKGLDLLLPVFKKALEFNPNNRFQTMEFFSVALIEKMLDFAEAKMYISVLLSSGDSFDERSSAPSFWKNFIATQEKAMKNRCKKPQAEKKKEKEEEREDDLTSILLSVGRFFGCAGPREKEKPQAKAPEKMDFINRDKQYDRLQFVIGAQKRNNFLI